MLLGLFTLALFDTATWFSISGWALLAIGCVAVLLGMFADRARGKPRCRRCGYSMRGSSGLACPECGRVAKNAKELLKTRRHVKAVVVGVASLLTCGATFYSSNVHARYVEDGEDFLQALIPTTWYTLRLPSLSDPELDRLSSRIGSPSGSAIFGGNGTPPDPSNPVIHTWPIEIQSLWQRWLFTNRCRAAYLMPSQSRDRRAQVMQWLIDVNEDIGIGQKTLRAGINDPNPYIQKWVFKHAATHGPLYEDSADVIAAHLSRTTKTMDYDSNAYLAQCALYDMGKNALPVLMKAAQDQDRREPALEVMLALGPDIMPAAEDLIALLPSGETDNEKIWFTAMTSRVSMALAMIGEPCFDVLVRETRSDTPARRAAAAKTVYIMAFDPNWPNDMAALYQRMLSQPKHVLAPDELPVRPPHTSTLAFQRQVFTTYQDMVEHETDAKLREWLQREVDTLRDLRPELLATETSQE